VLCAVTLAAFATARAATPSALLDAQWLRLHGCAQHAGAGSPLRRSAALDAASRGWAAGLPLGQAIDAAGYRAERSVALHVRGDRGAVRAALLMRACGSLTDTRIRDVGMHAADDDTWLLLAAPFHTPPARSAAQIAGEVLRLVNSARAHPRRCGYRSFTAAAPLRLDDQLTRAAGSHAQDMLVHDYFAHSGWDGSTPAARVAATGYRSRMVGENIAFGPQTAAEAVRGWLASPGHCENIMDPAFVQTGVAFAANRRGSPRVYWVQDFGAPARLARRRADSSPYQPRG